MSCTLLAISLRVTDSSMNQPHIKAIAKRREELAPESGPIVKHDVCGNHLPLLHSRDEGRDCGTLVWSQEEITEGVALRVII